MDTCPKCEAQVADPAIHAQWHSRNSIMEWWTDYCRAITEAHVTLTMRILGIGE